MPRLSSPARALVFVVFSLVVVAPVLADEGEIVILHFRDFGILRAQVSRQLPTGFALDLMIDDDAREKLAAKIRWKKTNFQAQAEGLSTDDVVQRLVREMPPPLVPKYE